jgi:hypothetical protein
MAATMAATTDAAPLRRDPCARSPMLLLYGLRITDYVH